MATIRQWLTDQGFDFVNGQIILQSSDEDMPPGWSEPNRGYFVDASHPMLDLEFVSNYGAPNCPRFIARDHTALYFPDQYDGATDIVKVILNLRAYIGDNPVPTPYPGG